MFGASFRIARVWGIPIKIHISLILLLVGLALSLGLSGNWNEIGLIMALELGVFTSIALHELGHSFVALRKGCRVREITLMFIGGAAQMEDMPRRPMDEFLMAVAGPAVSVVLGFGCWFAGGRLGLLADSFWPLPFVRSMAIRCNIVQFIGVVNIGLAIFNLVPAFPMDGGRILRALLASRLGRVRATYVASRMGKLIAILMGVWGYYRGAGGWILIAIAFFLFTTAGREYRMVQLQEIGWRPGVPPQWPFGPRRGPPPLDKVIISPPPYEKGPDQKADLRSGDEDL